MGKDPAFLFYPGDYLRDTQCLCSDAQVAYDRIMCEHMRNIPLSKERVDFFMKRLDDDQKNELMSVLSTVDGGYLVEWVAESIEKRKAYSESRRKNRQKKAETYDKDVKNICEHMEDEIEDEVEDENKNEIVIEYRECSELLKTRILQTKQMKITDKTLIEWDRSVRLMIEKDDRSINDIQFLINECHDMEPQPGTGFTWRNNILSMPTLRKRWNEGKIYIGMNKTIQQKQYGRKEYTKDDFKRQMEIELE